MPFLKILIVPLVLVTAYFSQVLFVDDIEANARNAPPIQKYNVPDS